MFPVKAEKCRAKLFCTKFVGHKFVQLGGELSFCMLNRPGNQPASCYSKFGKFRPTLLDMRGKISPRTCAISDRQDYLHSISRINKENKTSISIHSLLWNFLHFSSFLGPLENVVFVTA